MAPNQDDSPPAKDSSLVDALASELAAHLSRGHMGGDPGERDDDVRAALGCVVEQMMGEELDSAAAGRLPPPPEMSKVDFVTTDAAAEGAGKDIVRTSGTYAAIAEAVRRCAETTKSVEGLDDSSGAGQKKRRSASPSIGEAGGGAAVVGDGSQSFSLFDMLDRQAVPTERVTSDMILGKHKEGHDTGSIDWDGLAELLERIDEVEDIINDPFSGFVWEDVREVLRSGLLHFADRRVATRYTKLHSKLVSMCEKSPNAAECGQQQCGLLTNVLDALAEIPIDLGERDGEVSVSELVFILVRTWHGMMMRLAMGLEYLLIMDDELDSLLGKAMVMAASPTLAQVLAAYDPRADWFLALMSELPVVDVLPFISDSGLLMQLIGRCHSLGSMTSISPIDDQTSDYIILGGRDDLQQALYLQSLSMLQCILVLTDGCPYLFPYCGIDGKAGYSGRSELPSVDEVGHVILPFKRTIEVGIGEGGLCVDEDMAKLCGTAIETIIMGQIQNRDTFTVIFSDFIDGFAGAIKNGSSIQHLHPCSYECFCICRNVLEYRPWEDAARLCSEDTNASPLLHCIRLLEDAVNIVLTSVAQGGKKDFVSTLNEICDFLKQYPHK